MHSAILVLCLFMPGPVALRLSLPFTRRGMFNSAGDKQNICKYYYVNLLNKKDPLSGGGERTALC